MENIREQNRIRKQKQREKQKQALPNVSHVTSRDGHATDKMSIEEDKYNNISCAIPEESHDSFFVRIWNLFFFI